MSKINKLTNSSISLSLIGVEIVTKKLKVASSVKQDWICGREMGGGLQFFTAGLSVLFGLFQHILYFNIIFHFDFLKRLFSSITFQKTLLTVFDSHATEVQGVYSQHQRSVLRSNNLVNH